jgi:PhnB protein
MTTSKPASVPTPYLIVKGGAKAIEFYVKALGATEMFRLADPEGKVGHAELRIGSGTFMLADEHPDVGAVSPPTVGGTPVSIHLYVEDVDATVERAIAAGATVARTARNEFYGDRAAIVHDPFGHRWYLATRVEEVTPEEIGRRFAAGAE